jgi:hypothetical protein
MKKADIPAAWLSDPGHAWLVVAEGWLKELGIVDKISRYSYRDPTDAVVFLEEDCDAPEFFAAAGRAGRRVKIVTEKHLDIDAPIRDYPRY